MENNVIMFLDDVKKRAAKWESGYGNIVNKQISLISLEEFPELKNNGLEFSENSTPMNGSVYLPHPFQKNEYVELEKSSHSIQIEKINNFSHICQLLGASEIIVNKVITTVKEFEFNNETGLRTPKSNVSNKIKKRSEENNTRVYKLHQKFGEVRTPNYAAAYKTYQERLLGDLSIKNLLDSRNPELAVGNLLSFHDMELTISNEVNSILDIASNLSGMKGFLSLSNEYQQKLRISENITLKITVNF